MRGFYRSTPQAFSLIEIVLALGIMSFALVSILGLFPMALTTAAESKAETRIALIAQTLWAEIQSSQNDSAKTCEISISETNSKTLSLTTDGQLAIAFDSDGRVAGEVAQFSSGSSQTDHFFLANVSVNYQDPVDPASEFPGLTKVEIRIDYPAAAPEANRSRNTFLMLIRP
ncbi:MAG: hypothetical protein ACFCUX_07480 [Candidatus Methylacidiphilales bacterium]